MAHFSLLRALVIVFTICFSSLPLLAQTSAPPDLNPVRIQLSWYHQWEFAGYYAAKDQGYYAAAGLDVDFVEIDETSTSPRLVAEGRAEYGVSPAELIFHRLDGRPLVLIATIFQHSAECLRTRADSGINTLADLRGKVIGLHERPEHHAELIEMLRRAGLGPDDYQLAPKGWDLPDLVEGRIAAAAGYTSVEPRTLRVNGIPATVWAAVAQGVDVFGDSLFTREDIARSRPAEVEAMREASIRGWRYALDNPEEIAQLIISRYRGRERGLTVNLLLDEARKTRACILPELVDVGYVSPNRVAGVARMYENLHLAQPHAGTSDPRLDGFIFSPPRNPAFLKWFFAAVGVLVMLSSLISIWNIRLRAAVRTRTAELENRNAAMARAQETLRSYDLRLGESEARYRALFEKSPQPMLVFDTETLRVLDVNAAACRQYGYSRDEFLAINIFELRPEEDRPALPEQLRIVVRVEGPSFASAIRHRRKDGSIFEADSVSESLPSVGPNARLAIITDVTERMRSQRALTESEERYQLVIRGTQDGVWDWHIPTNVTHASGRCKELLGHSPEELLPPVDLLNSRLHPDDKNRVLGAIQSHLDSGARYDIECRLRTKSGIYKWFHARGEAVRDESGKPVRMAGSITDITQRKALEAEREAVLARLQLTLSRMPIGCILWDEGMRFAYVNPAAERIFGYTFEELEGKEPWDLIVPEAYRPEVRDRVARLRRGDMNAGGVNENVTKHGRTITVEWHNTPLQSPAGSHMGVLSMCLDVTERAAAQTALRHSEETLRLRAEDLARSNADLERFAYLASHDLQEPLRMVASYVQLLAGRYKGKLDNDADEFIGYAVEGVSRMRALINDLLQYSRVNTAPRVLAPVESAQIARRALDNLRIAVQESGARVTIADNLPIVHADSSQLMMVFQNLIGNAIKFRSADRPPEITVSADPRPHPHRENGHFAFSVTDNGIGIEERHHERIFQMFQRLHTRKEYPGNGIGLAICKRIVEGHHGRMWIRSALGEGSTFSFTLPAEPPPTPAA